MAAGASILSVLAGTALAVAPGNIPVARETIERLGGILMIFGLGLLGAAIRQVC